MTIPSFKILKKNAQERTAASENARRVVLIYAGIVMAISLVVLAANAILDNQIAQTGGLSNMGLRSILSTVRSVLPMLQSVVIMCLEIGYLAAMLRVSRRQYTSEKTLQLGFSRFWLMLRCSIIQGLVYMGLSILSFWLSLQIFLLSPFSANVTALLEPLTADPSFTPEMLLEGPLYLQLVEAMIPLFFLFAVVFAVFFLPLSYSLRMVNYLVIEKPGMSAVGILQESRRMMRSSRMRLFKLDLSLWWWYLLSVLLSLLAYGDVLLPMAGISLPISPEIAYYAFLIFYLIAQFAVCYFLRNRIEVVYAQVYDALKPREKQDGVVLGNIFQM